MGVLVFTASFKSWVSVIVPNLIRVRSSAPYGLYTVIPESYLGCAQAHLMALIKAFCFLSPASRALTRQFSPTYRVTCLQRVRYINYATLFHHLSQLFCQPVASLPKPYFELKASTKQTLRCSRNRMLTRNI